MTTVKEAGNREREKWLWREKKRLNNRQTHKDGLRAEGPRVTRKYPASACHLFGVGSRPEGLPFQLPSNTLIKAKRHATRAQWAPIEHSSSVLKGHVLTFKAKSVYKEQTVKVWKLKAFCSLQIQVEAFREQKNNTHFALNNYRRATLTHYAKFLPEQNLQKGSVCIWEKEKKRALSIALFSSGTPH